MNIALFLSADGLALAHRQPAGHWAMIGETPLAIDDLDGALAALRDEAVAREGENFKALLVLPDDQMLYTSLTVPTADPELTAFRIEEGLDGMTPYAVTELEYDWRMLEEDRVSIAVVARETLDEAKGFAAQYGFKGAGFAAMPPMQRFPGVPTFAVDADADDFGFSADGIAFGPDRHGQPDPEPESESEPEIAQEPPVEAAPEQEPAPEPEPVFDTATPEPDPAPQAPAFDDTPPIAPSAEEDPAADQQSEVPMIDDITTPIQPLAASEPDANPSLDEALPPAPSPAAQEARQRARVIRGEASAPVRSSGSEPQVTAQRGTVAPPETGTGSLVGKRSARIDLAAPENAGSPSTPTPDLETDTGGGKAGMPRLAEQLQRVRSASKIKPKGDAGGAPQPRPRVEIEPRPPGETAAQGLGDRSSPFAAPPQATSDAKPVDRARKSGLGGALRGLGGAAAPAGKAATGAASGGFFTRNRAKAATTDQAQTASAAPDDTGTMVEDGTFASGLLARKSVPAAGPSFKTGLVLTVILLLLLALVAIWSAVFLPNSTVARLFGFGGADTQTIAAAPSAVQAPDVFTDAPSIGGSAAPTLADEAAADGMDLAALPDAGDAALPLEAPAEAPGADEAELPDIDAEFDLPPLPTIDQGQNPTVEEAEALYAEDGIWARSPERPDLRPFDLLDSIYTASIDPQISALDAVALPEPGVNPGELLRRIPPPPPFGTEFSLTDQGLVAATSQGVVTPEGAFVVAGAPPVFARQRPREIADPAPTIEVGDAVLGTFRPTERPANLDELRERQVLGGLTTSELGERRPPARPQSPQEAAAAASLFRGDDGSADTQIAAADPVPDADVTAALEAAIGGTDLAVARSRLPATRPSNISQIVASADRQPTAAPTAVAAAAVAPGPDIPSNADVSRAATDRDAMRLRNVNLIGVTGTNTDRRALVRLSSGRFVRVTVGDRLDGGRVAAIGETTLQYVRSGRTVTLEIPG